MNEILQWLFCNPDPDQNQWEKAIALFLTPRLRFFAGGGVGAVGVGKGV